MPHNVLVVFTCYNRKEKTKQCIETLAACNPNCAFSFVVADDGSTDGTVAYLAEIQRQYKLHLLQGVGNWFYAGGMRAAMEYTKATFAPIDAFDYCMLVNDDVSFFEHSIEDLIAQSKAQNDAVIVGATCDADKNLSYSAIRYEKGIRYTKVPTEQWQVPADTFNANCVLVPYHAFQKTDSMDAHYRHSLGDFDYGLALKKAGFQIYVSQQYVGQCDNNSEKGTWIDTSLRRTERFKQKESVKGAPFKPWFYFLRKNFGLFMAIKYSITPYIRILLGK